MLEDPGAGSACAVWAWHAAALTAFLAIAGQWRVAGGGMGRMVWLGLDYTAAQAGLGLAGITVTPEVWTQVRQIEAGAREELNAVD